MQKKITTNIITIYYWFGVNIVGLPDFFTNKLTYVKKELNYYVNNQLRKRIKF